MTVQLGVSPWTGERTILPVIQYAENFTEPLHPELQEAIENGISSTSLQGNRAVTRVFLCACCVQVLLKSINGLLAKRTSVWTDLSHGRRSHLLIQGLKGSFQNFFSLSSRAEGCLSHVEGLFCLC